MSIISKITNASIKAGKKMVGMTPKPAQKVTILSDEVTKIPGTLNLTTGTKTFKDIGSGIRVVVPGESTKLGKLGIESITTFPKDYFIKSDILHAVKFKGAEKSMPLMDSKELKGFFPLIKELKDAANPVNQVINKVTGLFKG